MARWPKEDIPDADRLFLRVHHMSVKPDGELASQAFRPHGGGVSTDWEKWSTPRRTRAGAPGKPPSEYGVVSLVARTVRTACALRVLHDPIQDDESLADNRAHANIEELPVGEDVEVTAARLRLRDNGAARWEIAIDAPVDEVPDSDSTDEYPARL